MIINKSGGNCAAIYKSGWWYNSCSNSDMNQQPPNVHGSVLFSEIKIHPKDCITQ